MKDLQTMGNWQLEVVRMMLYIAFPVGMFHYFNQSENVQDTISLQREKYFSSADKKKQEEFKAVLEKFNSDKQIEKIKELENQYNTYATA